jgi:phytoene dehydrogenase-like protein
VDTVDAVVIGSGPNGLVAATTLARRGWVVAVLERGAAAGGAVQSAELTVAGYVHDPYSAFYGLLHASPVFTELGLDRAVDWAWAPAPVAAAVGPEDAAVVHGDPDDTARALAKEHGPDGDAWRELWQWWETLGTRFLELMLGPVGAPRPALAFAWAARRDGVFAVARTLLQPLEVLAAERFHEAAAQALVSAGASHFDVGIDQPGSVPAPLILAMTAQRFGMPVPVGGAGRLAAAMVDTAADAGASVRTGVEVTRVVLESGRAVAVEGADGTVLRVRRAVLADTGPVALFGRLVDEDAVPPQYLQGIRRFRYGTGVFKLDLALDGAVPWMAPELSSCAVVHLTGDLRAMAHASHQARHGELPGRPVLVVGQQSVADPSRAPAGGHTLWIETHVPGAPLDGPWTGLRDRFTDVVLDLVEAHAPGFRGRVVASAVRTPADLAAENPNLVGGDLGAGSNALDQQLVFRPVPGWFRYATPVRGLYLCSASAHPGGGVHGMGGRNAARRVLADHRRRRI